jgi:hypothetical protein
MSYAAEKAACAQIVLRLLLGAFGMYRHLRLLKQTPYSTAVVYNMCCDITTSTQDFGGHDMIYSVYLLEPGRVGKGMEMCLPWRKERLA